jgi:hypothetical protein
MECADRDRLHEVLRIATHELKWALEELGRILAGGEGPGESFSNVVEKGIDHHRTCLSAYQRHIADHGCAATAAGAQK